MGPSIEVKGLSLRYGNDQILHPFNHQFDAGGCHVIMGPNGGGKTSLIRSVLGLTPFEGEISIHWPQGSSGKIGYVPQAAGFEASLPLTVMDFVLLNCSQRPLFGGVKRTDRAFALTQLERVGMADKAKRRMGQLSGGEQQRVLFAQALLDNPDLIVLDEPATGMDKDGLRYLDQLMMDLLSEGKTLLMVHHDIRAVRRLEQARVHVINRRLITSGHPDTVLAPENIENLFHPEEAA
ncbi:metal ABC transporter ATP-binding protein [Ferrimonas marina]|uniref:Zinc transport system ATP-binding protein n=1 Tax=Ferrimonas marina TaxID=299255 RepID=A0A1M5VCA7_9GAMM|nr:metal ABC transporter ATP-binding protein [Ferrimonas marina]SHH72836.1 zinc transport system ATP-binding protein [Ferrimonas marina]